MTEPNETWTCAGCGTETPYTVCQTLGCEHRLKHVEQPSEPADEGAGECSHIRCDHCDDVRDAFREKVNELGADLAAEREKMRGLVEAAKRTRDALLDLEIVELEATYNDIGTALRAFDAEGEGE